MRRLIVCAALGALAVAPAARAATSGHIDVGNPTTGVGAPGVTELLDACIVDGDFAGVDGQWFAVGAGKAITVDLGGGATGAEDLDVYFYDSTCGYIADSSMATGGTSESGTSPAGTAFMVVDLFSGADASFEVTIA
jgi:hypothetical protein